MYEMKDEYLTGIPQIDEEHRTLFEIAEEAYQLKCNEFILDKYDNVKAILKRLRDYTYQHFDHEEAYMKSIGYNKIFIQKVQHDAFRAKLDELDIDDLDENSDETVNEILIMLTDWLVNHILENDKQIAE